MVRGRNGGVCGQVGSPGGLDFGGVDWDALGPDHRDVVGLVEVAVPAEGIRRVAGVGIAVVSVGVVVGIWLLVLPVVVVVVSRN